jgi:hypothetical protein
MHLTGLGSGTRGDHFSPEVRVVVPTAATEYLCLLRCDAVFSEECLPTFQRNVIHLHGAPRMDTQILVETYVKLYNNTRTYIPEDILIYFVYFFCSISMSLEFRILCFRKSSVFWDCNAVYALKINQRFEGRYRFHLHGRKISQARN